MSCRRCSTCGISYPTTFTQCDVCGEETDYIVGDDPDPDWEGTVEFHRAEYPSVTEAGMRDYRRRELRKLGFAGAILDMLADANTDVHLAREMIARGCPLETAARILL